jgi:hypothetical protein
MTMLEAQASQNGAPVLRCEGEVLGDRDLTKGKEGKTGGGTRREGSLVAGQHHSLAGTLEDTASRGGFDISTSEASVQILGARHKVTGPYLGLQGFWRRHASVTWLRVTRSFTLPPQDKVLVPCAYAGQ